MDVFQMRHKSVETVYQIFKLFPKCVPNLQQISHKRLNRRLKSYCDGFPDITNPFPTIDEFQMCHKSVETFPNYCKLCTKSLTNRQQIGPKRLKKRLISHCHAFSDIKLHSRLGIYHNVYQTTPKACQACLRITHNWVGSSRSD